MSKIFEALNKGQRESLELVDLIGPDTPPPVQAATKTEEVAPAPAAPAAVSAVSAAPKGPEPPIPSERAAAPSVANAPRRRSETLAPSERAAAPEAANVPPKRSETLAPSERAASPAAVNAPPRRSETLAPSERAASPAAANALPRGLEPPVPSERAAEPVSPSGIRTLPLRLAENSPILPFDNLNGRASEQYRIARTRILQHPKSPRIVLVSSPGSGDGKTITAINLAGALSLRAGFNVLLVDGDFRRSSVHRLLGLPEGPGLAEVLSGTCTLEDALVHVEQFPNLYVLPSGNCQANPAELLDSAQWIALQGTLKRRFRSIVVDSPPVAAVADYELLLAGADGVILVVRVDHTNRQVCLDTIRSIPPAKYMGVLLNCLEPWFLGKTYGYDDAYYSTAAAK